MKRFGWLFFLSVGMACAAPIFLVDTTSIPDTVTLTLFNDGSTTTFDVHGTVQLDVFNPGFIGAIALFDSGQPFGNNVLAGSNFSAELASVLFDFTNPVFTNGGLDVHLIGLGSPITTVSDPALAALLGSVQYDFTFLDSGPTANGTASIFGLTGAEAVPEPNSMAFVGGGFALILLLTRRKLKRNMSPAA